MPKHVETFLTTLGIPAEDAVKIVSVPDDQEVFDAKPYAEKVRANYQTQFKNDPDFFSDITIENLPADVRKKIHDVQFGRASGIATQKVLKAFGMTEADYADLPDEQKEKIETLIPVLAERYAKTKAGDKQLQADLIEARKQLEKYGPDYEKGIETKYQTSSDQKVTAAIFNAALISELSSIPGLKIKASTLAREASDILASKYAFERVGDYNVELRQKANPSMIVLKEGSSKALTLHEALSELATSEGWIESQKEGGSGSGVAKVTPQNGQLLMSVAPQWQDKISKKIADEGKP